MSELIEYSSSAREGLLGSLQSFENEGCRWGYGTITSSNTICYGMMNSIPSKAGSLASSIEIATREGLPGTESELASDTRRVAKLINGLRGGDDERLDYNEASATAIDLLLQWDSAARQG